MTIPNLFIVGAPKCGTTSLYFYLDQHPDIYLSSIKEPHYFNSENKIHFRKRSLQEYLALFKNGEKHKYIGEGSTQYLISENATTQIRNLSPDAKIIIALRRPVDLIQSVYDQLFYAGHETAPTFSEAIKNEKNRSFGNLNDEDLQVLEHKYYSQIPLFSRHVERYISVFGKDNVHIVLFDELKQNSLYTVNSICSFLKIEPLQKLDEKILNSRVKPTNLWFKRFLISPPQSLKNIFKAIVPSQDFRRKLFFKLNSLNTTKKGKREPISLELENELVKVFREEVDKMSLLIEKDLSHWNSIKSKSNIETRS